jgi:hypothetical protein
VPNYQLSQVFNKRTTAVVILFFAVSIGFFIYRRGHMAKFEVVSSNESDTQKAAKSPKKFEKREGPWSFYFEDSVAPSGRYNYPQRHDTAPLGIPTSLLPDSSVNNGRQ